MLCFLRWTFIVIIVFVVIIVVVVIIANLIIIIIVIIVITQMVSIVGDFFRSSSSFIESFLSVKSKQVLRAFKKDMTWPNDSIAKKFPLW